MNYGKRFFLTIAAFYLISLSTDIEAQEKSDAVDYYNRKVTFCYLEGGRLLCDPLFISKDIFKRPARDDDEMDCEYEIGKMPWETPIDTEWVNKNLFMRPGDTVTVLGGEKFFEAVIDGFFPREMLGISFLLKPADTSTVISNRKSGYIAVLRNDSQNRAISPVTQYFAQEILYGLLTDSIFQMLNESGVKHVKDTGAMYYLHERMNIHPADTNWIPGESPFVDFKQCHFGDYSDGLPDTIFAALFSYFPWSYEWKTTWFSLFMFTKDSGHWTIQCLIQPRTGPVNFELTGTMDLNQDGIREYIFISDIETYIYTFVDGQFTLLKWTKFNHL